MGRVHGQVGKRVVALNSKIGKVNLLTVVNYHDHFEEAQFDLV